MTTRNKLTNPAEIVKALQSRRRDYMGPGGGSCEHQQLNIDRAQELKDAADLIERMAILEEKLREALKDAISCIELSPMSGSIPQYQRWAKLLSVPPVEKKDVLLVQEKNQLQHDLRDKLAELTGWHRIYTGEWYRDWPEPCPAQRQAEHPFPFDDLVALALVWPKDWTLQMWYHPKSGWHADGFLILGDYNNPIQRVGNCDTEYEARLQLTVKVLENDKKNERYSR